jgi:hypothetical protein
VNGRYAAAGAFVLLRQRGQYERYQSGQTDRRAANADTGHDALPGSRRPASSHEQQVMVFGCPDSHGVATDGVPSRSKILQSEAGRTCMAF